MIKLFIAFSFAFAVNCTAKAQNAWVDVEYQAHNDMYALEDDTTEKSWRATYTWGAEVNIVEPCGSDKAYWVLASEPVLEKLRRFVEDSDAEPYTPVYFEFTGSLIDMPLDGFAAQYDGHVRIEKIRRLSHVVPNSCQQRRPM